MAEDSAKLLVKGWSKVVKGACAKAIELIGAWATVKGAAWAMSGACATDTG